MQNQKATMVITITSEEGRQKVLKYSGKNEYIAFILGEFGILGKEKKEILNDN